MLSQAAPWHQLICVVLLTSIGLGAMPASAEQQNSWRIVDSVSTGGSVRLRVRTDHSIDSESPFFVVTHGMGGTSADDRFHQLADALLRAFPRTNVLLVDWSEYSCAKTALLGLPDPFSVAMRIDGVGDDAARMLCKLAFDPQQATFIGESFGNWVNARVAAQVGGVNRIVAMNPASEFGGYPPPDLSACARISWSFHSYSIFDTLARISHKSILLETSPESSDLDRHTCGIRRLTHRLNSGDRSWLKTNLESDSASVTTFKTLATLDGQLVSVRLPRERPTPEFGLIATEKDAPPAFLEVSANPMASGEALNQLPFSSM